MADVKTSATGRYWSWGWKKVESGPDFLDQVADATKHYVLPAIALVVGTVAGGVGGILVAAFITTVNNIAKGARVSDALISSAVDNLPSIVSATKFDKTLATARSSGLGGLAEMAKGKFTPGERAAFDLARIIGTARLSQEKSLAELKAKIPEKAALIDEAAASLAVPVDIANALGGTPAAEWMDKALERNAGFSPEVISLVFKAPPKAVTATKAGGGGGGDVIVPALGAVALLLLL
jgi:hypothetical protein